MEQLKIKSNELQNNINTGFKRYLTSEIDWHWRLNGILGARGTGKTTMLLQRLKERHGYDDDAIYISLDDLYFSDNNLVDFVRRFRQKGGKYLFLDEVHKYPGWARELKNIYDTYTDLHVIFTGSSIIDLLKLDADLSRRAVAYHLHGLSFREYLELSGVAKLKPLDLEKVLNSHTKIALQIAEKIKPLAHFEKYLKTGYYPYFIENIKGFSRRLEQTLNLVIESDLNFIEGFAPKSISKIKQLLYILSANVPFKPNIVKLSQKTGINRNTLVSYLHYLEKAQLINAIYPAGISTSILQKPEKIFLNNTNLSNLLSAEKPNEGNIRETFFLNQLKCQHQVKVAAQGDFEVDGKYVFEIGGKSKTQKQIKGLKNAFIVSDDIESGAYNKIPLWLFGFLY